MEGARPRGPATQGRVCLTCRLQQAQRFGDRLLSSRPAARVWKTTRIFTRKRRSCVRKCLRRMGATRCPGRHHTHMCMTGTGDTACCQIAATLQDRFGADCAVGCLGEWRQGDRKQGVWDGSCAEMHVQGFDCFGISSAAAVIVACAGTAVGGNWYRAIIQDLVEWENRCAPRECPLDLASRDRPARVEPQAMPARGRDVSTSSMQRYALSYAIRHPAAVLLARARARRRKRLRCRWWLALCCTFVGNRTCPPIARR
jgi:hypothetical protein